MKKFFLLGFVTLFFASSSSFAAGYITIDQDGNLFIDWTGGTDLQSCIVICRTRRQNDINACTNTTYFSDPRCSSCGGMIQPISGACLPAGSTTLDELTECLYTTCYDDANDNFSGCTRGCHLEFPRKHRVYAESILDVD